MALSPRARIALPAAFILLALAALIWYLSNKSPTTPVTPITPPATSDLPATTNNANLNASATSSVAQSPESSPTPAASPSPSVSSSPTSSNAPPGDSSTPGAANAHTTGTDAGAQLLIPVAGIKPEQLQDTYTQSRSEGRTHNAIDIMAARNTPVLAATDGTIIKLFQSQRGGITIYQLGTDNRTVYYYAHLERYADGITEKQFARRGDTIGYVGDTGNAGKDNCHLHFSISLVSDPKHYWDGENINPYPLLTKR
jgi:murein DD-endopeptidase MepM/ murein hydrolase activator NlpD